MDANVPVLSGDRVLRVDVYRPGEATGVTVVVTRTMYGKGRHLAEGRAWAARGFAFVVQDVRGRYESDGCWEPYRNEREDGAALLDWLASQPWAGDIVLSGGSYNAFAAWSAALARPDVPAAIISTAPVLGFDRVKFDPSGVLRLDEHVRWWVDHADGRVDRAGLAEAMLAADPELLRHCPVIDIGRRLGTVAPGWATVVDAGPQPGPEAIGDEELSALDVPTLTLCGLYDLVTDDAIRLWQLLGTGAAAHRRHTLILGPWDHDLGLRPGAASTVFPTARLDLGGTVVDWLQGLHSESRSEVRVLPIGSDRWIRTTAWSPHQAGRLVTWHAQPDGSLRHETPLAGDAGDSGAFVEFVEHFNDPFPSVVPGSDRSALENRTDVVRFTSAPLPTPMTIAGRPTAELVATSSAPGADWIVRLAVVTEDGRIAELSVAVHVASSSGRQKTSLRLTPVAATLDAGCRLRLEVAAADFPRLARNPGTGDDRYRTCRSLGSTRRVMTAGTALRLPVVAGEQ